MVFRSFGIFLLQKKVVAWKPFCVFSFFFFIKQKYVICFVLRWISIRMALFLVLLLLFGCWFFDTFYVSANIDLVNQKISVAVFYCSNSKLWLVVIHIKWFFVFAWIPWIMCFRHSLVVSGISNSYWHACANRLCAPFLVCKNNQPTVTFPCCSRIVIAKRTASCVISASNAVNLAFGWLSRDQDS